MLYKVSDDEPFRQIVESWISRLRLEVKERPDLEASVRLKCAATAIHEGIAHPHDEPAIAQNVRDTVTEFNEAFTTWALTLLPGEMDLLLPPKSEVLLLEECIRLTPVLKSGVGGEGETLPDFCNGQFRVSEWVTDMAFSNGGRFSHNSIGPIPYFIVIFESGEIGAGTELRLVKPTVTENALTLPYQLLDVDSDPLTIEFSFLFDQPMHVRTLALMALLGSWRLDLLTVKQRRSS